MKKLLCVLTILSLFFSAGVFEAQAAVNKKINANLKTKRVPQGTVMVLKFLDAISSATGNPGDGFDLMVVDDVKVGNETVIPAGSVVRGALEEVQNAKRLYKGGTVKLYFDHIVSATGKQVTFYADICNNPNITPEGALSSKTNYAAAISQTAQTSKRIVTVPVSRAWEKGDELLGGSVKYVFAPVTAIVAVPVAGLFFVGDSFADIFKKGKDFTVDTGDVIYVRLLKPVDMPVN